MIAFLYKNGMHGILVLMKSIEEGYRVAVLEGAHPDEFRGPGIWRRAFAATSFDVIQIRDGLTYDEATKFANQHRNPRFVENGFIRRSKAKIF